MSSTPIYVRGRAPGELSSAGFKINEEMIEAIVQNPEIDDKGLVSVYTRKGNKPKEDAIHIVGELATEKEKQKVYDLIKNKVPEGTNIVDEMKVDPNRGNIG
ncbi:MAG: hypothetical protein ACLFR1_09180 [Spirochaetia bacterium]